MRRHPTDRVFQITKQSTVFLRYCVLVTLNGLLEFMRQETTIIAADGPKYKGRVQWRG